MKEQIKGTPQLYYEYVALNKEAPGEGSVMSPQRVRMSSSPLRNERQQQKKNPAMPKTNQGEAASPEFPGLKKR